MTSHLKSGDRRYDRDGREVQLIHHFRTTTPRQSLWSVVNAQGELNIVEFGPQGPRYRKTPKLGAVGTRVKPFSNNAEWLEGTSALKRSCHGHPRECTRGRAA